MNPSGGRYLSRKDSFDQAQRLRLVEDDLDADDATFDTLKEAVRDLDATLRRELLRLLWAVVSLALAVAGAAIAFTYNALVK